MNEKESREIVAGPSGFKLEKDKPYTIEQIIHAVMRKENERSKAEGYLEARDVYMARARGLEEALEKIGTISISIHECPQGERIRKEIKEALAKFRFEI